MSRPRFFIFFCAALLFAGCATSSKKADALLRPPSPPAQVAPGQPVAPGSKLPAGEYSVLIDSQPAGGTVVVNGIPVGRTPQRVVLPGTTHGFFREQVSLKVRFVATDTEHTSQTIEEFMTPLDKIPASVLFTPAGANRVTR